MLDIGLYNQTVTCAVESLKVARFFVNANRVDTRAVVVCSKWIEIGGSIFCAAFDFKGITNPIGIRVREAIGLAIKL